jgi:hypothetical protein
MRGAEQGVPSATELVPGRSETPKALQDIRWRVQKWFQRWQVCALLDDALPGSAALVSTSLFFFVMVGIVGNDCASPNHWYLQKLTDLRDLDLPNSSKFPTTESLTHKILGILPNLGM